MLSLLFASLIAPAFVRPHPRFALQEAAPKVQAPGDADDEFARLVPSDACVVVRARSLQSVYDTVREVAHSIDKSADLGSIQALIARLDGRIDVTQIALDRPVGLAMTLDAQGANTITAIVPAVDARALAASFVIPAEKARVLAEGRFVVITDFPGYSPADKPSPNASGMAPGDITVRVDAAKLIAMFRPVIDQTLDSFERAFASGAGRPPSAFGVSAILERYVSWARTLVDSAETLDFAASNNAGTLAFSGALTCRAGSAMATWLGGAKLDLARASRLLDPGAALQYVIAGDMPKLCASVTSILAAIADKAPEDMRDSLGDALHSFDALGAQLGSSVVTNGDWTADGLRGCAYVQAKDPAALLASYLALLDHDVLARSGCQVRIGPDVELAGVKWKSVQIKFDAEAWARLTGGSAESDEDGETGEGGEEKVEPAEVDVHVLQEAIDRLYGAQGMQLALAPKADQLVVLFGIDEARARAALARVDAKTAALDPALAAAIARVDKSNGALVMRFDYGTLVEQTLGLLHGIGGSTDFVDALAGLHLPVTTWAAIDGRVWKAGLTVRIDDIGRCAAAIEQSFGRRAQRAQIEADIVALCAAVDMYTIQNGGRAPESLEVLVTPDENGRTFLNGNRAVPLDPWKRAYRYEPPTANTDYRVYTLGRDGKPGGDGEDIDVDNVTFTRHR